MSLQKQAAIFSSASTLQPHIASDKNVPHLDASTHSQERSTLSDTQKIASSSSAMNAAKNLGMPQALVKNDLVSNKVGGILNSAPSQITNSLNTSLSSKSSVASTSVSKPEVQILAQENKNNAQTTESSGQRGLGSTAELLGQNLKPPSAALLADQSPLLNNFRGAVFNSQTPASFLSSLLTSSLSETANLGFLKSMVSYPGLSLLAPQFVHAELGQGVALFNSTQLNSHLIPFQANSALMASLIFQFPEYASLFYSILIGEIAAQLIQRKRDEKERARRKRVNKYGQIIRTEAAPSIDVDVHEGQEEIREEIETWVRINSKKETLRFWEQA
ncbi:MAG: hypothetical protein HQM15_08155 [Deltaproteobacteria bacterium]|nr:hypothetical protein [Deltaproteobacteria bacterium]